MFNAAPCMCTRNDFYVTLAHCLFEKCFHYRSLKDCYYSRHHLNILLKYWILLRHFFTLLAVKCLPLATFIYRYPIRLDFFTHIEYSRRGVASCLLDGKRQKHSESEGEVSEARGNAPLKIAIMAQSFLLALTYQFCSQFISS